jgi:hypothetical protein
MGVSRADRVRILQTFEVNAMKVRTAVQSDFGLRYFSDSNRAGGSYLFEAFPASRGSLAIKPEWSTMYGFRQFQVRPGATILEGPAASQGAFLPGGQTQKFILDWRSDLISAMKTTPLKTNKVKILLKDALHGVQQAQAAWVDSPLDFTTEEELAYFAQELGRMIATIEKGQKSEVPGLWRIVTDMWPYTNQLRQKIVEAELSFEKLQ